MDRLAKMTNLLTLSLFLLMVLFLRCLADWINNQTKYEDLLSSLEILQSTDVQQVLRFVIIY
jgi:hypothetical protein